jgi:hypothetical protein
MKKSFNILSNRLSDSQMQNITMVTKETIAFNLVPANQQIFTAADLWNIHRNLKQRVQRRFL